MSSFQRGSAISRLWTQLQHRYICIPRNWNYEKDLPFKEIHLWRLAKNPPFPSPPLSPGLWLSPTTLRASRWRSRRAPTRPPTRSPPRRGSTWSRCTPPPRTMASSPARQRAWRSPRTKAYVFKVLQVEKRLCTKLVLPASEPRPTALESAHICAIVQMYLCNCANVLVQLYKCICETVQMYLCNCIFSIVQSYLCNPVTTVWAHVPARLEHVLVLSR